MSDLQDSTEQSYPLHECVFEGDVRRLSWYLRTEDVKLKDKHGNTALHLAVMLGRKECVHLLLAHGAPVKLKNLAGWSPLAEAISYGDRPTILSLVRKLKQQAREQMEIRRPDLIKALMQIQDFYMELKWDFHSWVPLVSRILPSDVCKIYKQGPAIRLDTTLVDFTDMKWERGDISFIFRGDQSPADALTILDNQTKVFQKVRYQETDSEIQDEVDILMSSDILAAQMSTKAIAFNRAQSGWIFRENRKETVAGIYKSDIYTISGLVLESRKRREHLSNDDLQKNKALLESLTSGGGQSADDEAEPIRRASLNPPPECLIDWETYITSPVGEYPPLGRKLVYKESTRHFRATVAMSDDFPLTVSTLLNVLEIIAPFKHFAKLRQFIAMKLPKGFPVKVELPILHTVTAKITFQAFSYCDDFPPELFNIPDDYVEDPLRFPDL